MLCSIITVPSFSQAITQIEQAKLISDLLELRIDLFDFQSCEQIQQLKNFCKLSVIFTLQKNEIFLT